MVASSSELWAVEEGRLVPRPGVRPRLLIVEDDQAIGEIYRGAFEDTGWDLELFETAEAAISRADNHRFHLALIDKNLPGMDGLAFMRQLRANDQAIGCLMVTGYSNAETSLRAANLRVDAYIEKPWKIFDMLGRTERVLSTRPTLPEREQRLLSHFIGGEVASVPADQLQPQTWLASGTSPAVNALLSSTIGQRHQVEVTDSHEEAPTMARTAKPDVVVVELRSDQLNRDYTQQLRDAVSDATMVVIASGLDISHVKGFIDIRVAASLIRNGQRYERELGEVLRVIAGL
jgi:DNA-binding response OmpR family regulator